MNPADRGVLAAGGVVGLGLAVALGSSLLGWPLYEAAVHGLLAAGAGALVAVTTWRDA